MGLSGSSKSERMVLCPGMLIDACMIFRIDHNVLDPPIHYDNLLVLMKPACVSNHSQPAASRPSLHHCVSLLDNSHRERVLLRHIVQASRTRSCRGGDRRAIVV